MAGYNLKRPEEVKEYLKNLHIEYQFGCYSEKNGEVCHLLGEFKSVIKKEFDKAAELYKLACDTYNYGRSCTQFGDMSLIGKGCPKDMPTAFKYMSKGCELQDSNGCYHAGVVALLEDMGSEGKDARLKKAVEYLRKSCDEYNVEDACFYLAGAYFAGVQGYINQSYPEACKWSLKACEKGHARACVNLAQMYEKGEGVEQNQELAQKYKQRALDLKKLLEGGDFSLKFGETT